MNIQKTNHGNSLIVSISGKIDTASAPTLEQELKNSIKDCSELTFDFTEVEYISSAGLRVLLSAQKTMNRQGSMKLTNVKKNVMGIFEVTGFTNILNIE